MSQLHKIFMEEKIKALFQSYYQGQIRRADLQEMLRIDKSCFFVLYKEYLRESKDFSIVCERATPQMLSAEVEIKRGLRQEKEIV